MTTKKIEKTTKKTAPAKKKTTAKAKKTESKPKKVTTSPVKQNLQLGLLQLAGVKPYKLKKDEEYMSESQKQHFTKILMAWYEQILIEAERTKNHMQKEFANFADPSDRATQEEEFSLELRNREREFKLLKKIKHSLNLIKEDNYGFCDMCGIEIGLKRLEARPTAELCIDCKTLSEIREKQMGK